MARDHLPLVKYQAIPPSLTVRALHLQKATDTPPPQESLL